MSFLLQKRRGGGLRNRGRNNAIPTTYSRNGTTAASLLSTRGGKNSSIITGRGGRIITDGGDSQQLMIQRPQIQQTCQSQVTNRQKQQKQQQQNQKVQKQAQEGMISMEEGESCHVELFDI